LRWRWRCVLLSHGCEFCALCIISGLRSCGDLPMCVNEHSYWKYCTKVYRGEKTSILPKKYQSSSA
jgi:hypothetical protein